MSQIERNIVFKVAFCDTPIDNASSFCVLMFWRIVGGNTVSISKIEELDRCLLKMSLMDANAVFRFFSGGIWIIGNGTGSCSLVFSEGKRIWFVLSRWKFSVSIFEMISSDWVVLILVSYKKMNNVRFFS